MSTVQATDVAERFLAALSHRDFGELAATFVEDGVLRGLVPSTLREEHGNRAVAGRFRFWFDDVEGFEVVESGVDMLADVVRIRWRVVGFDPELGPCVTEQTAYAGLDGGRIAWMNLVCSGDRPLEE